MQNSSAISVGHSHQFLTRLGKAEHWMLTILDFLKKNLFYMIYMMKSHSSQLYSKVSLHIERKHWKGGGSCPKYFCQNCQNLPLPNLKLFLKHFKQVHSYDGTELTPIKQKRLSKACSLSLCWFLKTLSCPCPVSWLLCTRIWLAEVSLAR